MSKIERQLRRETIRLSSQKDDVYILSAVLAAILFCWAVARV